MHIQLTNEYRLIAAAIVSNQRALSYQRCQSIGYYYSGTGTTELCAASMDGGRRMGTGISIIRTKPWLKYN